MAEQLPPRSEMGQDFVVSFIHDEGFGSMVKIIYSEPMTEIHGLESLHINPTLVRNNTVSVSFDLQGNDNRSNYSNCHIKSSKPIFVASFIFSVATYDAAMVMTQPVSVWGNYAELLTFDSSIILAIITASCDCISNVQVAACVLQDNQDTVYISDGASRKYCSRQVFVEVDGESQKIVINGESCAFGGYFLEPNVDRHLWATSIGTEQFDLSSANVLEQLAMNSVFLRCLENTSDTTFNSSVDLQTASSTHHTSPAATQATNNVTRSLNHDQVGYTTRLCPCSCRAYVDSKMDEVMMTATIHEELSLQRRTLSKQRRQTETATDSRLSSTSIGFTVSIVVFAAFFGSVVLPDLGATLYFLYGRIIVMRGRKTTNRKCRST